MTPRIALWALAGVFGISAWTFSYAVQGFADIEVQKAESYSALQWFNFGDLPPCVDWKFDIASTSHGSTTASTTHPRPPRPGMGIASTTATTTATTTHPRPPRPCRGFNLGAASTTATTTATTTKKLAPKPPKPTVPNR